MAQLQKSTSTKLKDGSKDKFYDFFKFHVDSITDACPNIVKSIQLTDGTTSWEAFPGNRKVIEFQSPSADGTYFKDANAIIIDGHFIFVVVVSWFGDIIPFACISANSIFNHISLIQTLITYYC